MIKRNNVIDFAKFIFSVVILLNHSNSLALYMGHWPVLLFIANDHALSTFQLKFVTYFVCSFIVSFLLQKGGNLLKNLFGWIGKEAKSLFVLP